ncbi:MAG TPA: TonB-dependent receptor [Daejeonella sp.]|nr:TonB-dependent receptor [Daejeonella sp.]
MKRILRIVFLVGFCQILLQGGIKAQVKTSTISGHVIDGLTGLAIPGASISLKGSTYKTSTDTEGKFIFKNIPLGTYQVWAESVGYAPRKLENQSLTSGKELSLIIEMDFQTQSLQEIVITGDRSAAMNSSALVSARSVNVEQTKRYAGNFGDISRQVANYSGVNVQGDIRNDIVVRGNSPNSLLWRLEGLDIPNPNHFSFVGTTGGYFSVLNNNMLANSDFFTGAFPAEYGNKNGAVMDVKLKKGNDHKREYTFQAGLNGLELGAEGPINPAKNKNTFVGHYRYFDLSSLRKLGVNLNVSGLPLFQDLNFKLHFPNSKGSTSVFGVGGISSISLLESQKGPNDWSFSDKAEDMEFSSNIGVVGVNNTYIWDENTVSKLSFAVAGNRVAALVSLVRPGEENRLKEDLQLGSSQGQLKFDLTRRLGSGQSFKTGFSVTEYFYNYYQQQLNRYDEYEVNFNANSHATLGQAYINYQVNLNDNLKASAGIYSQMLMLNKTHHTEPRLALQYSLSNAQTLGLAFGQHSQSQPFIFYLRDYTNEGITRRSNKNLDFSKSKHWVLSHEYRLDNSTKVKTELYYQGLSKVPVTPHRPFYSAINEGNEYSFEIPDSLENKGRGKNYGIEFSLEKSFTKNLYFLTTASLFESKYQGSDQVWRNTVFNNNYIVNFLAGYEFSMGRNKENKFSVDVKASFAGGRPFIPIDLAASIAKGERVLDYQRAYEVRTPAYNRIDVKLSYLLNKYSSNHSMFIGVNNILDSRNILKHGYNADKAKITTEYMQGRFPILGYRLQF